MSSRCLSEAEVLAFAQGQLAGETARLARAHVDACVPCGSRLLAMGHGGSDPAISRSETRPEPALSLAALAPEIAADRPRPEIALPEDLENEDAWENLPAALLPGTVLAETYHVGRRIGVGGMGQVYEATHARLAGRYAVKVLHPRYTTDRKALTRFRREAMIASGLRHPNIVQIIDFQTTAEGTPFLVMEFLDGQDLARALTAGPLSLERTVRIIDQVAAALTAVHRHGIVHRDLKPQNVFLIEGDYPGGELVKVVDFGISKIRTATSGLTLEQLLVGTPEYMAPEQAIGDVDHIAPATDQFALAAIVYEMLTGRPAFVANTLAVAVFQVVNKEPRSMREIAPGIPLGVEAVVRRGLAKKAAERFPTIGAFAEALRAAAQAASEAEEADADDLPPPRAKGLSRSLLAGAAVGATLLVGFLAASGLRSNAPRTAAPVATPSLAPPAGPSPSNERVPPPAAAEPRTLPATPDEISAEQTRAGAAKARSPAAGSSAASPPLVRLRARRGPLSSHAGAAGASAAPSDTILGTPSANAPGPTAPVPAPPTQGLLIEKLD